MSVQSRKHMFRFFLLSHILFALPAYTVTQSQDFNFFPMLDGMIGETVCKPISGIPFEWRVLATSLISDTKSIARQTAPYCVQWIHSNYPSWYVDNKEPQTIRQDIEKLIRERISEPLLPAATATRVELRIPEQVFSVDDLDTLWLVNLYLSAEGKYCQSEKHLSGQPFYLPFQVEREEYDYQLFWEEGTHELAIRVPVFSAKTYIADLSITFEIGDKAGE